MATYCGGLHGGGGQLTSGSHGLRSARAASGNPVTASADAASTLAAASERRIDIGKR